MAGGHDALRTKGATEMTDKWTNAILDDRMTDDARDAWHRGMSLGASIEHRVALQATATALLTVLGKDAADGVIDLGAAGRWHYSDTMGEWRPFPTY